MTDLEFPVLMIGRDFVDTAATWDDITLTTRVALRKGVLRGLLLVDSAGRALRVNDATKVKGVGWFGGYNIFGNQRIRVRLETSEVPRSISTQEVRELVLKDLGRWHGWASGGDLVRLKKDIQEAKTVGQIVGILAAAGSPPNGQPSPSP